MEESRTKDCEVAECNQNWSSLDRDHLLPTSEALGTREGRTTMGHRRLLGREDQLRREGDRHQRGNNQSKINQEEVGVRKMEPRGALLDRSISMETIQSHR